VVHHSLAHATGYADIAARGSCGLLAGYTATDLSLLGFSGGKCRASVGTSQLQAQWMYKRLTTTGLSVLRDV
jgi:hypothetical protein